MHHIGANPMADVAYLLGKPQTTATFRYMPDDFRVDEVLNFELDGDGEHFFVRLEKTNMNTAFAAAHLASVCGVRERDVNYCGLKDRRAVTTQWFSVHLPGKPDPDPAALEMQGLRVISYRRHRRKLRRGAHAGNDFMIILRDIDGDRQQLDSRLQAIQMKGFPNYFGGQRFGHQGQNIERARQLFSAVGRRHKRDNKRGIYLSAARSYLFNRVLSQRIVEGRYGLVGVGDVLMLAGSHSVFSVDQQDATLQPRLDKGDVHLTGPMWGAGKTMTSMQQHAWEQACFARSAALDDGPCHDLADGLVAYKMKHERRALRAFAKNLQWQWLGEDILKIHFHLDNGSYATSFLREATQLRSA